MIELPEANVLARQITELLAGREVVAATANSSPHKFAWYHGDPAEYHQRLAGKSVGAAHAHGGLVEVELGKTRLLLGEGVSLRYIAPGNKRPAKHQLLVEFDDGSALSATAQMYGGLWCFLEGEFDNPYYQIAKAKPSPLLEEFNQTYFQSLLDEATWRKSAKAFLATEQRIPGLGNGVLQDILFNARIHPRRRMESLSDGELTALFSSVKDTLRQMTDLGGRDTEKDLRGNQGGYPTRISRNTLRYPCPVCGSPLKKEAYLGGSIYFCTGCQAL
ncbi:MAG: DNA-formamidopyrimidine glycosylase family protein [Bacillota bacterium]